MKTKKKIYVLIAAVAWIILLIIIKLNAGDSEKKKGGSDLSGPVAEKPQKPEIPKRLTNSLGMEFVYIPPGTFMIGSSLDEPGRYDREAQHEVTLSSGFYMQTTEVTQKQWETVMKSNPSYFKDCEACPVEQVSWNDTQRFIWRLNQMERGYKYSLPTEAEWEYACRAGTTTRFNWGDEPDCSKANYGVAFVRSECKGINPGKPMKGASFPPNPWGLYDMHGNVAEWCLDRFSEYPSQDETDPVGSYVGMERVYRGGSWSVTSRYCRSANRDADSPNARLGDVGFRLVRAATKYGLRGNRIRAVPPYH